MAFSSNSEKKMFNEINITPLTDIFLVLLIIMMVVAPTFQSQDNAIKVPQINSGLSIDQKNATVSITKEGKFFLNGNAIESENLEEELSKIKDSLEKKEVVVKADKQTKSSDLMKVMQCAQSASFEKLVVAGEPLSKQQQEALNQKTLSQDNFEEEEK